MLKIVQIIIFLVCFGFIITLNILLWEDFERCWRIGGIIAIATFLIAYSVSGGMTISRSDMFRLPRFKVFTKKLGWALTASLVMWVFSGGIIYLIAN